MFRIDDPTAVAQAPATPAPTGSTPGFFTNGSAAAGTPATLVEDWWLNQVQEELYSFLTPVNFIPLKGTNNQVFLAAQKQFGVLCSKNGGPIAYLPTGLIIQTFATPPVQLGSAGVGVSFNVTYPVAFPNGLLLITARDNGTACIVWDSFINPGLASATGSVWSSQAGTNGALAQGAVTAIGW